MPIVVLIASTLIFWLIYWFVRMGGIDHFREQSQRLHRPILTHLNHPNFGWGVSVDDLAAVVEEHYFEVYNGHPGVHQLGDETRPSVERMWAKARRIAMMTKRRTAVITKNRRAWPRWGMRGEGSSRGSSGVSSKGA